MEKYILIGIPSCGKSTLGSLVANELNMSFFDTDKMAYSKLNIESPIDIIRVSFNGQFLAVQTEAMLELAGSKEPAIIATGAEVALIPKCSEIMKKMGTVIHIKRDIGILLEENQKKGDKKEGLVLINNGKKVNMHQNAINLYAEEYSKYEALADLTLENNGNEKEGVKKLIDLIRKQTSA